MSDTSPLINVTPFTEHEIHKPKTKFRILLITRLNLALPCVYELLTFSPVHADYIDFLRTVTPNSVDEHMNQLRRFNMGSAGEADCPVFDGLFEYCQVGMGGYLHMVLCHSMSFFAGCVSPHLCVF